MNKIYFIALMLFFSVPAAFGWDLVINNMTPFEAHLSIGYTTGCREDRPIIAPGKIYTVNAKECLVGHILGALVTVPGDSSQNIPIKPIGVRQRDFSVAIVEIVKGRKAYGIKITSVR